MKKAFIIPLLLALIVPFLIASIVNAHGNNLFEHFLGKLPSIKERAEIYKKTGLAGYIGSIEQNEFLIKYLHGSTDLRLGSLANPPSTVEGTSTAGWTDDGSIVRLNTQADSVGIGTVNPAEKLTVQGGNIYLSGNFTMAGGTFNFGQGNGTSTLTATQSGSLGNIGIGTTTPRASFAIHATSTYFTGTTTLGTLNNASSSMTIAGVPYIWPTSQGSNGQTIQNNGNGVLTWAAGSASTTYVTIQMTAEQPINASVIPQALAATSSPRVFLADADSTATGSRNFIGFAELGQNKTNGEQITVITDGIIGGFDGTLNVGDIQYLSNTAGSITTTITSQRVGVAVSSSSILMMPILAAFASDQLQDAGSATTSVVIGPAKTTQDFFQATGFTPSAISLNGSCVSKGGAGGTSIQGYATGVINSVSSGTNQIATYFDTETGPNTNGGLSVEADDWITSNNGIVCTGDDGAGNTISSRVTILSLQNGGFTIRISRISQAGTGNVTWTNVYWTASR